MGIEKWIFLITLFLMTDTYYDGKYTKWLLSGRKYYKMITYGMIGLSLYIFIKKHPDESKSMMGHASEVIKYLPVDRDTTDLLTPFLDFTNAKEKMNNMIQPVQQVGQNFQSPQVGRMMNSGLGNSKRSVSETKKKYIASQQNWKCIDCGEQLTHTFEVDHKIDLQFGGTNHVTNLNAKCVGCHKEKTVMHKLQ